MAFIEVKDGENLDIALKRFKRLVQRENIVRELKQHMFYLRPGEKDRIKRSVAQKRRSKHLRIASAKMGLRREKATYRRPELPPIAFEAQPGRSGNGAAETV